MMVPLLGSKSSMLITPEDLSNDDLEEVARLYSDDLVVLRLSDYLDVRTSHVMCASVLKVAREENAELTRVVRDEFASDKATSLSVRAMTVMENGIRKVLKMTKEYRQFAAVCKKGGRPRLQRLDQIIHELEKVCPVDNIDTFMEQLFKEERNQKAASEGIYLHNILLAQILPLYNYNIKLHMKNWRTQKMSPKRIKLSSRFESNITIQS